MTDGNRIKKTSGSLVTRTFFPHYEEEQVTVWPYTTTAVKHYSFSGMRIAISKGGVLSYIHSDHLGSSSVEMNSSGVESASRTYYAYGTTRSSSGTLQTDRTYTGQKQDGTGLALTTPYPLTGHSVVDRSPPPLPASATARSWRFPRWERRGFGGAGSFAIDPAPLNAAFNVIDDSPLPARSTAPARHSSRLGEGAGVRVLKYVHSDHLGSSSVETNSSGASTAARTYYAYGTTRSSSGTLQTDRTYTGQKEDSTGLHYYNARYYDSALGTFLSPDTLVPDAGQVVDYNRFLYVRGSPLSLNDPSGRCATIANGERDDANDSECWIKADSILNMWDETDYWSSRWPDKDAFIKGLVYNPGTDADFFQWWLNEYWQSPEQQEWREKAFNQVPRPGPHISDYVSVNATYPPITVSYIKDQFGRSYISGGFAVGTPGISVTWNDLVIDGTTLDTLAIPRGEKAEVAREAISGVSQSASVGFRFMEVNGGYSLTSNVKSGGGGFNISSSLGLSVNILQFTRPLGR